MARTTTKQQLIRAISREKQIHPNDVRHIVQAFLDKAAEALTQGHRVVIRDFATFDVVPRKKRVGRNPKDPSVALVIPACHVVKVTPGKRLRAAVAIENPI